jgi:hypothetical protein
MSQYATYSKFYTPENAQFLISLLQQHNIPYTLEHEVNQLDKVYLGENIEAMYVLSIPGNRFNEVNTIQANRAKADMEQPGFEHYLQSYSPDELQEILNDATGWNAYDLQVAATLLSNNSEEQVAIASPVNDAVSHTPAKLDSIWIFIGYLSSVLGLTNYFFFGVGGFFSGLSIVQAKQTLPNGQTVKMYSEKDRRHGRYMMILSVVLTITGGIIFAIRYR